MATPPNYLESKAGKITVREGREARAQVPQTVAVTSQSSLSGPESLVRDSVELPLPTLHPPSSYSEWEGKQGTGEGKVRMWLEKLIRQLEEILVAWFPEEAQVNSKHHFQIESRAVALI